MSERKINNYHYFRPFLYTLSVCGYIFSCIYYFKYNASFAAFFMFTGPTLALLYSFAYPKFFYTKKTAYVLLFVIFYTLIGSSLFTGAHNSTAIWWLTVIPLTAGIFLDIKKSLASMILCIAIIIIEYILATKTNLLINEFVNKSLEISKLLSLITLNVAISTLTCIYLVITMRINNFNKKLAKKVNKAKIARAFNQGLFESSQNTLHVLGNNLTLIKTNNEALGKSDHLEKLKNISEAFYKQKIISDMNEKDLSYINYVIKTLDQIITTIHKQTNETNQKLDYIIETVNQMSNLELKSVKERISLSDIVNEVLSDMNNIIEKEKIKIKQDIDKNVHLNIEPTRLEHAIRSSINNAIDSLIKKKNENSAFLEPEILIEISESPSHYSLILKDNGLGIEENNLSHIFSLGFSTKISGGGYNLHNTANYIRSLGGMIDLTPNHSEGACLQMTFPK